MQVFGNVYYQMAKLGNKLDKIYQIKCLFKQMLFRINPSLGATICTMKLELKKSEELKSAGLQLQIKIKMLILILACCTYGQTLTQSL